MAEAELRRAIASEREANAWHAYGRCDYTADECSAARKATDTAVNMAEKENRFSIPAADAPALARVLRRAVVNGVVINDAERDFVLRMAARLEARE